MDIEVTEIVRSFKGREKSVEEDVEGGVVGLERPECSENSALEGKCGGVACKGVRKADGGGAWVG